MTHVSPPVSGHSPDFLFKEGQVLQRAARALALPGPLFGSSAAAREQKVGWRAGEAGLPVPPHQLGALAGVQRQGCWRSAPFCHTLTE